MGDHGFDGYGKKIVQRHPNGQVVEHKFNSEAERRSFHNRIKVVIQNNEKNGGERLREAPIEVNTK